MTRPEAHPHDPVDPHDGLEESPGQAPSQPRALESDTAGSDERARSLSSARAPGSVDTRGLRTGAFSQAGTAWSLTQKRRRRAEASLRLSHWRLRLVAGVLVLSFAAISFRLIDVAVMTATPNDPWPSARSAAPAAPPRADIVDRNGRTLATTLETVSLAADPSKIIDPEATARRLVSILPELGYARTLDRLTREGRFIWIKRSLTPRQHQEIHGLGNPGLIFKQEHQRIYPQGRLAAHVVGFTNIDEQGLAGVERSFDERLRQRSQPLRLALDLRVQRVLVDHLRQSKEKFSAKAAAGVVMDARSGELVALTSLPDFDPNVPASISESAQFNHATQGVYEMGSTVKLFTAAMALEEGHIALGERFAVTEPLQAAGFRIQDFERIERPLTVPEIIMYSSNIGAARLADAVGADRQRTYLRRFGLLDPAAVELREVGRPLRPYPWRRINTLTIAYGHGLSISPVQLTAGVAGLINDGERLPPTLLRRERDEQVVVERIASVRTSRALRRIMRLVVAEGTGGKAEVDGYLVGGKTGTAEKAGAGGYDGAEVISSFVGAFPMDDPRYVVFAMLDEPQGIEETYGYVTGGWTAAPLVGDIIEEIGPMLGIEPAERRAPEARESLAINALPWQPLEEPDVTTADGGGEDRRMSQELEDFLASF